MLPEYPEARRRALARNVLEHTLRLKRGEKLFIATWSGTLPWAASFVLEARRLGARPMVVLEDEESMWRSVAEDPASSFGRTGAHEFAALKASNAFVDLGGPLDTARELALPKSLNDRVEADNHEWFRLLQKNGVRTARWDIGRTSERWAKLYSVDLDGWRNELIEAASVDPRTLQKDGTRVAQAFRRGREVTITHPNGTDLKLRLAGRAPLVDDGIIDDADIKRGNIVQVVPSGVTSATVDETYAEGTLVGNNSGVMFARGVQTPLAPGSWTFRDGHLVRYSYAEGGEAFRRTFTKFGAGKDRPGLVSVGLNPGISAIPLLFDQQRGTVTLLVGRNSMMGGATRTPHFNAYASVRGATLRVDGTTVVDAGNLVESGPRGGSP